MTTSISCVIIMALLKAVPLEISSKTIHSASSTCLIEPTFTILETSCLSDASLIRPTSKTYSVTSMISAKRKDFTRMRDHVEECR
jgi:hypothetical protein